MFLFKWFSSNTYRVQFKRIKKKKKKKNEYDCAYIQQT